MDQDAITIISGLPRSGTSMMMRMLGAGGMEILTDNIRTADEDNPQGYYEFERVKRSEHDQAWLADARGKAVKMISALLKHLPRNYSYKVIFMRRKMEEILASQKQMLTRREEPTGTISDVKMADIFRRHLAEIEAWLAQQPNIEVIYVQYDQAVQEPISQAQKVNHFLGSSLNVQKMARVVDSTLYRQRR